MASSRGKYQRTFPSTLSTTSVMATYILHILNEKDMPMYGREMAEEINRRTEKRNSEGQLLTEGYAISRGVLYGSLRDLEEKKLVIGFWEQPEGKPTNKKTRYLYKITPEGKNALSGFKIQDSQGISNAIYIMTCIASDLKVN